MNGKTLTNGILTRLILPGMAGLAGIAMLAGDASAQCFIQGTGVNSDPFGNSNFGGAAHYEMDLIHNACGQTGTVHAQAQLFQDSCYLSQPSAVGGSILLFSSYVITGTFNDIIQNQATVRMQNGTVLGGGNLPNFAFSSYNSGLVNLWPSSKSKTYTVCGGSVSLTGNLPFLAYYNVAATAGPLNDPNPMAGLAGELELLGATGTLSASGGTIQQQNLRFPWQAMQLGWPRVHRWPVLGGGTNSEFKGTTTYVLLPRKQLLTVAFQGCPKTLVNTSAPPKVVTWAAQ